MKHKPIPKKVRELIYKKYNGHCAYCGCEIAYKDMQVDHIEAVYAADYHGKTPDYSIDNFNPACRACNFYKSASNLETFRHNIEDTLFHNLRKNFNYKMLIKYGLLKEDLKPVTFYFEKQESENKNDL